ncbi:MAG: PepSY domain-containing protein [Gemmatimonadota bacterium]|nr:PepSY domain-containing protein [Gemmatimonadota bacterium]
MKKSMVLAGAVLAGLVGFRTASAQTVPASYKRDVPDSLAREATITEANALASAQRRVPRGKVAALELEREKGTLMYSFDFKVPGKKGIDEVNVDAKTGAVLHVAHESPAQERKEAAADAKEARAKHAKKKP